MMSVTGKVAPLPEGQKQEALFHGNRKAASCVFGIRELPQAGHRSHSGTLLRRWNRPNRGVRYSLGLEGSNVFS